MLAQGPGQMQDCLPAKNRAVGDGQRWAVGDRVSGCQ